MFRAIQKDTIQNKAIQKYTIIDTIQLNTNRRRYLDYLVIVPNLPVDLLLPGASDNQAYQKVYPL